MAAGDDITVHMEWLARHLTQQQEDAAATEQHRIMATAVRVSRVPDHVRARNADAYTPGLVAVGPLHAGDRRLRAGNRLKMAYLHSLISRGHRDPATHLAVIQGYVRAVAAREREARAMYADDVDGGGGGVSAEDLVQMLVLDGCFIIEHLVNVATGVEEPALHATPFGPTRLAVDLVLAENQIPFFVLVDLIGATALPQLDGTPYQVTYHQPPASTLMKLALNYLAGDKARDMSDAVDGAGERLLPPPDDVCHILHLLHATVTAARTAWEPRQQGILLQDAAALEMFQDAARLLRRLPLLLLVPLLYPVLPEENRWRASYLHVQEDLPSASDLKRMWVRLMKARGGSTGNAPAGIASVLGPVPLAVKLVHENRLRLPQLRLQFRTAPLLLNLMAFEQSADQRAGDVSTYVWLMAKLVQSPEDAGVLMAADVVQSGGESREDVARFFKRVGAESEAVAELEKSYLGETLGQLRKRGQRTQHQVFRMYVEVQSYYLNTPWRLVAAFVTVVTIVSTILQTYAAFKQKP